jgi:hypothetical protein
MVVPVNYTLRHPHMSCQKAALDPRDGLNVATEYDPQENNLTARARLQDKVAELRRRLAVAPEGLERFKLRQDLAEKQLELDNLQPGPATTWREGVEWR